MAALTTISIVLCLVFGFFLIRRSRHAVIRSATLSFCLLTILGAVLMLLSNYFHTSVESDSHCAAQVWLLSFGFSLLFSPLFIRTFRTWRIITTHRLTMLKLRDSDMILSVGGFILVDCIINGVWTGWRGMKSKIIVVDPVRPSYNYITCDYSESMGFVYTHLVLKCGFLLFGIALTWLVRNIPSNFNESSYIGMCIYNVSIVICFVVPLISANVGGYTTIYLIRAFAIMFVSLTTVLVLYFPKLLLIASAGRISRSGLAAATGESPLHLTPLDVRPGSELPNKPTGKMMEGGVDGTGGGENKNTKTANGATITKGKSGGSATAVGPVIHRVDINSNLSYSEHAATAHTGLGSGGAFSSVAGGGEHGYTKYIIHSNIPGGVVEGMASGGVEYQSPMSNNELDEDQQPQAHHYPAHSQHHHHDESLAANSQHHHHARDGSGSSTVGTGSMHHTNNRQLLETPTPAIGRFTSIPLGSGAGTVGAGAANKVDDRDTPSVAAAAVTSESDQNNDALHSSMAGVTQPNSLEAHNNSTDIPGVPNN